MKILTNKFFWISLIFLISIIVRFFIQQDMLFEVGKIQDVVVENYRQFARFVVEDGFLSVFDSGARVADLEFMSHPPGYSLLLTVLFAVFGESNAVIQAVSIFSDALSAILIFLIADKLLSRNIAIIVGLLAAFCPQFAYNSVLYLPDTLAIFPLLLSVYFFVIWFQNSNLLPIILCGICIGLSCWFRANVLLLPLFFISAIFFINKSKQINTKQSVYLSVALLSAFVLTTSPVTIRNAIVYQKFIPISLGAGQTLLEGIGDYDTENRFGIPRTDVGITRMEAEKYNRPDYAATLFRVDGINRDRMRLAQGFGVIAENPFWFGKVMIRRALWMTKLERVWLTSTEIPVRNSQTENLQPVWQQMSNEIGKTGRTNSDEAKISESENILLLQTDNSKNGIQFSSEIINVKLHTEYIAEIVLKVTKGRIAVKAAGEESGKIYSFAVINLEEWESADEAVERKVKIPFVSSSDEQVRISIFNESPNPPGSVVEIKQMQLFDLGQASLTWTRPFRFVVWGIQKLFVTGIMLTLAVFGIVILFTRKKYDVLLILFTVPIYFFTVQSILHTEYRYVMVIHYFFFVFAAVFLEFALKFIGQNSQKLFQKLKNRQDKK